MGADFGIFGWLAKLPGMTGGSSNPNEINVKLEHWNNSLFSTDGSTDLYGFSTEHQGSWDFFTRGPNFLLWGFLKRFIYVYA